jgi:ABC-type branched-subunit amino acid transport system ATPase component
MGSRPIRRHNREVSAATLVNVAAAASPRLLVDVKELHGHDSDDRESALERLEAVLGRDFADRLVAALSKHARRRLEAALSPEFADQIASALAKERGEAG